MSLPNSALQQSLPTGVDGSELASRVEDLSGSTDPGIFNAIQEAAAKVRMGIEKRKTDLSSKDPDLRQSPERSATVARVRSAFYMIILSLQTRAVERIIEGCKKEDANAIRAAFEHCPESNRDTRMGIVRSPIGGVSPVLTF